MLFAAMEASVNRIRALLFVLLAATLTSCSSNSDNPVAPPSGEGAPSPMVTIIGSPRVKVDFNGNVLESRDQPSTGGSFTVVIFGSDTFPTFLKDVRLQGIPMHEEVNNLGEPFRYTLPVSEIPGLEVGDTVHFDVLDGGDQTPPFSYRIVLPHVILPPDSTVMHQSKDLFLPWTGAVERVLVTVTDITNKRLTFNYQVENYTGGTGFTIPARDFAGLYEPGPLFVGTNLRDDEELITDGQALQTFGLITRQDRVWLLEP